MKANVKYKDTIFRMLYREYAQYVARVRKYASIEEMSLDEAIERAVDECIDEGILAEFLQQNKVEVVRVSIYEYDKEKEEKKLRKAEYEAGYESGREEGYNSGREAGYNSGKEVGYNSGKEVTRQELVASMYKEGLEPERISRIAGMDITEILKIINKG